MRGNPGKIVKYLAPDGNWQKAIAYHKEQNAAFMKGKQVLVHLINEDFSPKTNNGQQITALKQSDRLILIGFVD